MLANQVYPRTGETRDPRAEQTKFAVSEDGEGYAGIQGNLFGDAKGGGKGFDEDRVNVVNGIGNVVKVACGDSDLVGHRAVVLENPEDRAVRAMVGTAGPASWALVASVVDFGGDTCSIGCGGEEFMAENSPKPQIAAHELEVGVTDSHRATSRSVSPSATRGGGRSGRSRAASPLQ